MHRRLHHIPFTILALVLLSGGCWCPHLGVPVAVRVLCWCRRLSSKSANFHYSSAVCRAAVVVSAAPGQGG